MMQLDVPLAIALNAPVPKAGYGASTGVAPEYVPPNEKQVNELGRLAVRNTPRGTNTGPAAAALANGAELSATPVMSPA